METLVSEFERYRDRKFLFVAPGGNWGDHLIWWGAEYLADRLGLDWQRLELEDLGTGQLGPDPGQVIYLHGGGGFNRWSSGLAMQAFEKAVNQRVGVVIQGPQTLESDSGWLQGGFDRAASSLRCNRVIFFTRESVSHELLRSLRLDWLDLGLDRDTAFHLNRELIESRIGTLQPRYDLLALREDIESMTPTGAESYAAIQIDPARYASCFDHWLEIHAAARRIATDRTHSAIAGSLLEIPTTLLPGSYHKNRSIWELSLRGLGVRWCDSIPELRFESRRSPDFLSRLPRFARRSWKVRRFANRLRGIPAG